MMPYDDRCSQLTERASDIIIAVGRTSILLRHGRLEWTTTHIVYSKQERQETGGRGEKSEESDRQKERGRERQKKRGAAIMLVGKQAIQILQTAQHL